MEALVLVGELRGGFLSLIAWSRFVAQKRTRGSPRLKPLIPRATQGRRRLPRDHRARQGIPPLGACASGGPDLKEGGHDGGC
jgi:hypothetical protein